MYRCEVPHKPDKCCINFIYCSFVNLIFQTISPIGRFDAHMRCKRLQNHLILPEPLFNRLPVMHFEYRFSVMIRYHQASSYSIAQLILLNMRWRLAVKSYSWLRYCHLRAVSAIASRSQSPHLCLNVALELHLWMDHNEEYLALKYALLITTCKSLQIRPYVFAIKTTSWECRSVLY